MSENILFPTTRWEASCKPETLPKAIIQTNVDLSHVSLCCAPEEPRVSLGEEEIHPLARGCANDTAAAPGEEGEGPRADLREKGEHRRARQGRGRVRAARPTDPGVQQEGGQTQQERADHAQSEREQDRRGLAQK